MASKLSSPCNPRTTPGPGRKSADLQIRRAATPPSAVDYAEGPRARYSDRSLPFTTRMVGLGGTAFVCLLILALAFFRWERSPADVAPADLNVFEIAAPAAPPVPASEIPPGPEQVQKDESPPDVAAPQLLTPLVRLPSLSAQRSPAAKPATDPGPPVERTTAPEARAAPAAPSASDARPTWEGRVLAALNKVKRYPREASRNRQQGTAWIRFVMNRGGKIRSVQLERSSGFDALDREAMTLAKRAEPLPSPPDNVPGERIELVVPVEFFTG